MSLEDSVANVHERLLNLDVKVSLLFSVLVKGRRVTFHDGMDIYTWKQLHGTGEIEGVEKGEVVIMTDEGRRCRVSLGHIKF